MAVELTGLLTLFAGLAKAWLANNNTKGSKLKRKPEETQAIVRIWSKLNLTVVNCVKTGEKANVTYFYHKTLFGSLWFKTFFMFISMHVQVFVDDCLCCYSETFRLMKTVWKTVQWKNRCGCFNSEINPYEVKLSAQWHNWNCSEMPIDQFYVLATSQRTLLFISTWLRARQNFRNFIVTLVNSLFQISYCKFWLRLRHCQLLKPSI